jgi:hypothetical protein
MSTTLSSLKQIHTRSRFFSDFSERVSHLKCVSKKSSQAFLTGTSLAALHCRTAAMHLGKNPRCSHALTVSYGTPDSTVPWSRSCAPKCSIVAINSSRWDSHRTFCTR